MRYVYEDSTEFLPYDYSSPHTDRTLQNGSKSNLVYEVTELV